MTERILKDYFIGMVSADTLSIDLVGTVSGTEGVFHYSIEDVKSNGEFVVTAKHLIKICRDTIEGNLKLEDLNVIAFALEASDYFTWDADTEDGKKVSDALSNWTQPITMQYIQYCAYYLETGEHR